MVKRSAVVVALALAIAFPSRLDAQSLRPATPRIDSSVGALKVELPQLIVKQQPPVAAALHPAGKGALIGAAAGAGAMGVFAWWFCTRGPGECTGENVAPGLLVFAGVGAGVGALIGALK